MNKLMLALALFALPMAAAIGMEEKSDIDEVKNTHRYLTIETKSRISIVRDKMGNIELDINPRKDNPINIGGEFFSSPKKYYGISFFIGSFHINNKQNEDDFIKSIETVDHIVAKIYSSN